MSVHLYKGAVSVLFNNSADVNIMNTDNRTVFHEPSHGDRCDVMEQLLNNKAGLNAKKCWGTHHFVWQKISAIQMR